MKVCYFGIYRKEYSRNRILLEGLRRNGIDVIELTCRNPGLIKYIYLIKEHWKIRNDYDVMFVAFPGQIVMPLARLISRKKIVFDLFVSLYDSVIFERKIHKKRSLKGFWFYFLDWLSCKLADIVLIDTYEHKKYVQNLLKIKPEKIKVIYLGIDESLFFPSKHTSQKKSDTFLIEFHGYVTELHGLKYLVDAVASLKDPLIQLLVIGSGNIFDEIKQYVQEQGLRNIFFESPVSPWDLREKIINSDLGIGILGSTNKVDRVIPNKVFEVMACSIPVLTADTPAVAELFENSIDFAGCKKADVESIASAIRFLKNNPAIRASMASRAYEKCTNSLLPQDVVAKLLRVLSI